MTKSGRQIMEILEAFDLTQCAHSAGRLAGADPKTVARYVAIRDAGGDTQGRPPRPRIIDPYLEKIEELVERSRGQVRADVVHGDHLVPMGFQGDERTTRRAVATAKEAYTAGRRRTYRPWIPEPGMWAQYDWATGPVVGGRATALFCAWLAWSRFRVVIPTWDRTLGTTVACIDAMLRAFGRAPTYLLTDNERVVTTDRVAGLPVRHPEMVATGAWYGVVIETCVPYDPETKGGSEATVKIAKADLVPTGANLVEAYPDFSALAEACSAFGEKVNARAHTETRRAPAEMLVEERARMHALPAEAYTAALGETRIVRDDQTIRWGGVRYSVPRAWVGKEVWCRVQGEELVVVGRGPTGLVEIHRHGLSTPGHPRILDEHYPDYPPGGGPKLRPLRPTDEAERAFLALGDGAERWLREACGAGVARIRAKMTRAVELASLVGATPVDRALGLGALTSRFEEEDLASILDHLHRHQAVEDLVSVDEAYSAQEGTGPWGRFGR
ncbi:MAG TPA: IS21 family transposase [Acidimicrobiales bacterium]|jgi:transposase|nr:IS21 family transposase [Acidimicrobiales bacterium]